MARAISGPLEVLRVTDLSRGSAGPVATMMLADYGAEVVRIEAPGGDPSARYVGSRAWGRGKRSVCLDLKEAGARDQLERLLDTADVLVESFTPAGADKLGLGYAS